MRETEIQNRIRAAVAPYGTVFRVNVFAGYTEDGRYITSGAPRGFSDLFGFRHTDGKAFFIEVKTENGRLRPEQRSFIEKMKENGALSGVARSPEEAIKIIVGGK